MARRKFNRFEVGSGCFTCRDCGKQTRENGTGNASCGLCPLCFEKASSENALADNTKHPQPWGAFDACTTVAGVRALLTKLEKEYAFDGEE